MKIQKNENTKTKNTKYTKEQKKQTLTGRGHKCMWLRSILHQLHQNKYEKARNMCGKIDWNTY